MTRSIAGAWLKLAQAQADGGAGCRRRRAATRKGVSWRGPTDRELVFLSRYTRRFRSQTVEARMADAGGDANPSLAELARAIHAGSPAAESALVARLSRPLRLMFRMRRTPAADVDDLVQETLLVVLRRLRRELPDDPNGVQAFAEATARNLSIGEVRKRTRREELLKMAGETLSPAPELPPEPAWSASETARLVRQSLEQLGQPRDQMILREHYFNGIDKASLCARHGMSSAHFDRILFNARKRLRKLLRLRGIAEAP